MKVVVGTGNELKLNTVRNIFNKVFKDVEVKAININSEVPAQPFEEDIIKGALNRAKKCLEHDADFGVGIEAGIVKMGDKYLESAFCVIMDKKENYSIGSQPFFELPSGVVKKIFQTGDELGNVMDAITGKKDTKKKEGAVGIFSKGLVTRKDLLEAAIKNALIPWVSKSLYFGDKK